MDLPHGNNVSSLFAFPSQNNIKKNFSFVFLFSNFPDIYSFIAHFFNHIIIKLYDFLIPFQRISTSFYQ